MECPDSVWTQTVPRGEQVGSEPADLDMVRRALALLADPTRGVQLHYAPFHSSSFRTFKGDDLDGMCEWVQQHQGAEGIYYTLNPCDPALTKELTNPLALCRRNLLIDVDRIKTNENKKLSATDAEHEAARQPTFAVRDYLAAANWPSPILLDSGNGFHQVYRVDLPNDPLSRGVIKDFLLALSLRFKEGGLIGKECHDARRVSKLPGTWARKGPNTAERPWRLARLLHVPASYDPVPFKLIQETAQALKGDRPPEDNHRNGDIEASPFWTKIVAGSDGSPYAIRALENECQRMALAQPGELNDQLYRSGAALGNFVGAGLLSEQEVFDALYAAAVRAGCDNPPKDRDCLHRAIENGKTKPRDVPESAKKKGKASKKDSAPLAQWIVSLDGEVLAEGDPDDVLAKTPEIEVSSSVRHFELMTIGKLLKKDFPPVNWVVPDIMSEGLNILAGSPKTGKSMLALNLALTIAGGGMALGNIKVQAGDVLYLSLEDKQRRVKIRALEMIKEIAPELRESVEQRLTITTEWPRSDEGGLRLIDLWCQRVERPTLLIVDVWNRFSPEYRQTSGPTYNQDSKYLGEVKSFVDRKCFSAEILHHTRKPGIGQPEDYVNEVSGTLGLTGAADGIAVLIRTRAQNQANLHITGRDVKEKELVLEFTLETLTWKSLGSAEDHIQGRVQTAIIQYLRSLLGRPAFVKDIAENIDENEDSVRKACGRLSRAKIIRKVGNAWTYPGEEADDEAL